MLSHGGTACAASTRRLSRAVGVAVISSIAHPTDFSPASREAYLHALALALAYRCKLYLLHVRAEDGSEADDGFPHIRETLTAWGRLSGEASPEDIEKVTGVAVRKVDIRDQDPIEGLSQFLMAREAGLIVARTHGDARQGLLATRSISAGVIRETRIPTLFFGPGFNRPFIDPATGAVALRRVLMAVDAHPNPWPAVTTLRELTDPLGAAVHLTHVGDSLPPNLETSHSHIALLGRRGSVGATLAAASGEMDLIAMPTDPDKNIWERIVGSASTHVVGEATTPVLLIPAS
jgi:nucleotide-binding universal stress UspA family protein